jgi:hypothetical protein
MLEQTIRVSGATVSWSLTPTNREALWQVYTAHGFEHLLPPETSDRSALKGAMEDLKGKDQLVQALKTPSKNGYEVVNVERDVRHNHYTNNFSAWLSDGQVQTGYGYADTTRLQERFIYRKGLLAPSAVSESLKSIVLKMDAVTVYPGTYWVPQHALSRWQALARDVEQLGEGQNRLRQLTTVMDEHTAREVRDALIAELNKAATTIAEEVATGTLGDEALENRKDQAMALHRRIEQYEGILDETLEQLHATVEAVQQVATLATLQSVGV